MSRRFLDQHLASLQTATAAKGLSFTTIQDLFNRQPDRAERYSARAGSLFLDYSKQLLDDSCWQALFDLCKQSDLDQGIRRLLAGEVVNLTENRAAHHSALRSGTNRMVLEVLEQMEHLVQSLTTGARRGVTGQPLTQIVNIGIGGSDLGPRMVTEALSSYRGGQREVYFLANIDGAALESLTQRLDPARTLVCVTSKSFSTRETLTNANSLRQWMAEQLGVEGSALDSHFIAVTANQQRAMQFGVDQQSIYPMWDWVGGRFSLWSAVGLPIAVALGMDHFKALLDGARMIDDHFAEAPFTENLPVIMALLGIWQREIQSYGSVAVVPYDQRLNLFPDFLQQLDMESNGKSIRVDGETVQTATGPAIWGGVGTNGQHAFFQWLHQSPNVIPVEFIAAITPHHQYEAHHRQLIANMIGQSWALMSGRSEAETRKMLVGEGLTDQQVDGLVRHRSFPGNRPSTVLLLDELSPSALGQLIALYEHKVFVQGWLWGINSFDQWGVELGKTLASQVESWMSAGVPDDGVDSSTRQLIRNLQRER